MTKRLLLRSLAIASVFSLTILLSLAVAETTGAMWLGEYLFVFAIVAYGLTAYFVPIGAVNELPIVVGWLALMPAMVAFYWPVVTLALHFKNMRKAIAPESA